jgi:hypothetical protein
MNSGFYCDVLRRLCEKVRKRRPEFWREQTWLLHHGNATSLTSVLTQQFLSKYKMAVIPNPPYSPDLTPFDFFLFPNMKLKLIPLRDPVRIAESACHSNRKGLSGSVPEMEETVGPVSACGRVMAADWPYDEFYDFYSVSPEYFMFTLALVTELGTEDCETCCTPHI